jgi:hypothetical protein
MGRYSAVRHDDKRRRKLGKLSVLTVLALLAGMASAGPALAATGGHAGRAESSAVGRRQSPRPYLTPGQASAQARRTGKAVPVTGATTPTSTLTANPNGSFTYTESDAPVRARVDGAWRALNADLVRNPNGTYSPAVSSEPLVISGGGSRPLARMTYGAYSLALTAPMKLPVPVISGDTATYRNVLPGVNLIVTAEASGGFSDVLEIRNAAAAANPALQALTYTAQGKGLTLRSRDGAISAVAHDGVAIFGAPAPQMWDSAVKRGVKVLDLGDALRVDGATGMPAYSTAVEPGEAARTGPLRVRVSGDRLTLIPDRGLLHGAGSVFPEFEDPTWDTAGSNTSSWAYVSSDFKTQQYYNVHNFLQVGDNPQTGGTSESFYSLSIPNKQIDGATIDSVTAYFPEVWADSCTPSPVDLYETGAISSSTTYDNQPSWGTELGSDNVAFGWSSTGEVGGSSTCGYNDKDVAYTTTALTSMVQDIASSYQWPTLTVGLKAEDTSNPVSWKLFTDPKAPGGITGQATMTIKYADAPNTPVLSTSPRADCQNDSSTLGNGSVVLNAKVSDKDGTSTGDLEVTFAPYADGNPADTFATNPSKEVDVASGTTAPLVLSQANLDSAVTEYGTNGAVKITWTATVSDGLSGVPTASATCSFTFSTAIPGQPNITDSAGNVCGTPGATYTVGTKSSFSFAANTSATVAPTSYTYQLNAGNPVTVSAGSSSPYAATVSVAPTRFTNTLIVAATAASGNIGQAAYCTFYAAAPAPAVDQDLTGDGIPDLLTVGNGTTGTGSGLWLAAGQASDGRFDGTVDTSASDIAPDGPQDIGTPASWNGLKAFSGQFTDSGFNDIEAYQPGTGDVYILPGQGDGSAITSQSQNFTDHFDDTSQISGNTNAPQQLVNAYTLSAASLDGGTPEPYPDQIGLFTDPDSSVGSYLAYFANSGDEDSFDSSNLNGLPYELTNTTPDGSMDWQNWTITTDQDIRGGTSYVDMYLWNSQTGDLYLWELTGLAGATPGGVNSSFALVNPTATLEYTQTLISSSWNEGTSLASLQGTDVDGNPGLIAVTATGQVESYEYAGGSLTQVNATGPTQELNTATHTYLLNDGTSGEASSAADQAGAGVTAQPVTGNSATCWNNGDLFSPDVVFNDDTSQSSCGTSGGYMTTSSTSGLFTPSSNFTISAWVDPVKLGGVVLSQDGSDDSTVELSSTTGGQWSFSMGSGSSTSYVTATGGTAYPGMWINLVATFTTTGGADIMKLYADGVEVAYNADTGPSSATGKFLLGADQVSGAAADFLTGQLADVQVWDSVAAPVQPGTPASVFVPITPDRLMDTRSATKIGSVTGPVAALSTTLVPIDGSTVDTQLPASGVTAVAVAITVTGDADGGFLTAYPAQTPMPETSTVSFAALVTMTNDAIVPVGPDGDIAIFNNSTGTVQLIVDVTGYFTTNTAATNASTYTPLADPTTILDTRSGTGAPEATIAADGTLSLTVAGDTTNGVDLPSSGLTAVALNLTVVPTAIGNSGNLITYPDGISRPVVSTVTYDATGDQSQATTVLIPVGSDGKIDIYNASSTTINLVGELSGYFTTATTGQYYHPLDSTRIIDTRNSKALASDSAMNVADPASVLADDPTLVLNITVTLPADGGFLVEYPGTASLPNASIIDFAAGETVANLALVNSASNNSFNLYNSSGGTVQVVVDTDGYFD